MGNELWLEMHGRFRRWILRPDREGEAKLIAMPAGDFEVDPAYHLGKVPEEWRSRVKLEDAGMYEVVEGSQQRRRFEIFFTGRLMAGQWILQKTTDERHRSWTLAPAG
jgi:hypothetical protein